MTEIDKRRKCVIYLRVSTEKQKDNYSIPAQLEILREWAKKLNMDLIKEYLDQQSGKEMVTRDKFMEMVEDSKHNIFDDILTLDNDRFARNLKEGLTVVDDLKERGIYVHFHNLMHINIYSDEGRMMLADQMKYAEFFSRKLADKVQIGLRQKMMEGEWVGSPPYGFNAESTPVVGTRRKTTKLIINMDEINNLKTLYELIDSGKSFNRVAKELEELRIRTKTGKVKWRASVVSSLVYRRNWYEEKLGDLINENSN